MKTILLVALVLAGGCGKGGAKPEKKFVESAAPLEALGFTFDRPANVKVGEAQIENRNECCRRVEFHAGTGYLGAFSTLNAPGYYKNLDHYVAEVHGGDTVATKELLPSGAFYVEYRESHDSPKSTVRIKSFVTTASTSADCYAMPTDEELELARSVCRSFRVTK